MNVLHYMELLKHGSMHCKAVHTVVTSSFPWGVNNFLVDKCKWTFICFINYMILLTGGVKPNLADLAVFGVLRPIRHLQSGKDMVENTRIGEWYDRMQKSVGDSARIV